MAACWARSSAPFRRLAARAAAPIKRPRRENEFDFIFISLVDLCFKGIRSWFPAIGMQTRDSLRVQSHPIIYENDPMRARNRESRLRSISLTFAALGRVWSHVGIKVEEQPSNENLDCA